MSQTETSVGGNPVRTIDASTGNETYQLPNMASGRNVTIRRQDAGVGAYTATITIPSGHTLDGVLNGSVPMLGDSQIVFMVRDPGVWESYGKVAGSGATSDLLPETVTYSGDGTVASSTIGGVTTTYGYDGSGNVLTETRLGKVKTYTYDGSGNVTGAVVA
jgi:YD repeat-containing protein